MIAAAVIVGALLYAWLEISASRPPMIAPTTAGAPQGAIAFAPSGQLIAGFPKDLILDSDPAVSGSYSINYSSSTNQYTAEWNSSSSMESLYEAYKAYLPSHGWTLFNNVTKYAASRGLYARNAASDVSVAIVAQGSGSQVVLTYLEK